MAKKSIFWYLETISEMWGWIVIVLAFVGLGVGGYLVLSYLIKGVLGNIIGAFTGAITVFIGIKIANRAYKGKGTIFVLSRTIATPELDKKDDTDYPAKSEIKDKE